MLCAIVGLHLPEQVRQVICHSEEVVQFGIDFLVLFSIGAFIGVAARKFWPNNEILEKIASVSVIKFALPALLTRIIHEGIRRFQSRGYPAGFHGV